jgi:adenylate cyclase
VVPGFVDARHPDDCSDEESKMSKYGRASLVGFITAIAGIILALADIWTLEELNWLFRIRGQIQAPSEAVLITLDEQTADQLRQSKDIKQWSRSLHARLINRLSQRGASVIVFDVTFLEPRPTDSEGDLALATAISQAGRIVLSEYIEHKKSEFEGGQILRDRLVVPIPQLADAARGLGPFPLPDVPSPVNKFWTFIDVGEELPTLPAVALQVYALQILDQFLELIKNAGFRIGGLPKGPANISNAEDLRRFMKLLHLEFRKNPQMSDRLLSVLAHSKDKRRSGAEIRLLNALVNLYRGKDSYFLNFYGPPATIPAISYRDILDDNNTALHQSDLAGKAVFVGARELSKTTQMDGFYTAFSQDDGTDLSGVEIAATAFLNLLSSQTFQPHVPANIGILLLFGCLAGSLACLIPGMRAIIATVILGALYCSLALFLFSAHNLWIPVFIPVLFQLPVAFFLGLFCQYRCAKLERERLIPWVPNKIADVPEAGLAFSICLLTDIRGSRSLSSRLSATEYNSLMESYYNRIILPVKRNGGRVWDFSGDGMMCLFAAKRPELALRQHACLAALEILSEVELFNRQHDDDKCLWTGIGLHAGWLELGGKTLGDIGNTVSSIEGLNRRLFTKVLASQIVVEGISECLSIGKLSASRAAEDLSNPPMLRRLGSFSLPGKSIPMTVFEVMDFHNKHAEAHQNGGTNRKLCELFSAALAAFEERRWPESAEMFKEIISIFPDDMPSQCLLFNCQRYCSSPPQQGEPITVRVEGFANMREK